MQLISNCVHSFSITQGYPRLPKVACSSMRLQAFQWACMHFHELSCSSMSLHAVSKACMQVHELACSSMSLYAVPFFVWVAHKNFAELVNSDNDTSTPSHTTRMSLFLMLSKVWLHSDPLTHFDSMSLNMFCFWRRPLGKITSIKPLQISRIRQYFIWFPSFPLLQGSE